MLPRKSAPDAVYCVELLMYTIIMHIQLPLQDLICIIGSLMKLALWRKKEKRKGKKKHDSQNPVHICWEKFYLDLKRRGALKESDLRTTHISVGATNRMRSASESCTFPARSRGLLLQ
jgi:hypothetical protein